MATLVFHVGSVKNPSDLLVALRAIPGTEVSENKLLVRVSYDLQNYGDHIMETAKHFGAILLNSGKQNRAKDEFSPLKGNTKSEFAQEDPSEHMEADLSDILLDHYQDYKKTGNQASLQKAKEMAFKHYGERQSSHQLERRLAQRTQARNLNAPPSALQASIAFRNAQNTTAQQIQTAFSGFSGGLQDASITRAAALFAQGRFDEGQGLFKGKLPEDVIPKVMDWVKQNFKPNPKLQTEQTLDDPKFKAWVTTYFLPYIKSLIPKRTAQQLKDSKSFSPGTAVLVHTGAAEPIPGVIKQLLENGKYHVDLGQNGEYDTPASNIELDRSKQRTAQADDFQSVPHTRKSLSDFRAEEEWLEGVSNKFPSDEEYRKYCEALEAQFGKSVSDIVDRAPSADKMHHSQHQDTGLQEFLSVFPQVRRFTADYIRGTGHSEQHTSEYGSGDRPGKARSAQTTPAQTVPAQGSTGVSSTPPKTPAPPGKKYIFDMTSNNWILTAV